MENTSRVTQKALEEHLRQLAQSPQDSDLRVNKMIKIEREDPNSGQKIWTNPKYLPISFVQTKLDEIYYGLWETKIDHVQVIANEIIGHGTLTVVHPVTGERITRTGAGAVMVQQKKDADITDVSAKIKNTLVKDYPHLLAEITKSAAKTLGKIFGRDLNREHIDEYMPPSIEIEAAGELRKELRELLDGNILPTALHTFIEANVDIANFNQLCGMKAKAETEVQKLINKPV